MKFAVFVREYYLPLNERRSTLYFHLFSPTRILSDFLKLRASMKAEAQCPEDPTASKAARAESLIFVNKLYRILSSIIFLSIFLYCKFPGLRACLSDEVVIALRTVVVLYAISRVIEVYLAFLYDALRIAREEESTSRLTKEDRLKLALWSYVSVAVDFALLFWLFRSGLNKAFSTPLQAFYFSVVSIATIGYGDFYPTQWYTQACVIMEIACGLILLVVSLGIYIGERSPKG